MTGYIDEFKLIFLLKFHFPGNKRKYVSSPESSSPVSKPPKTGHSRVKREQKRVKHTRATHNACKTLFDYVNTGMGLEIGIDKKL